MFCESLPPIINRDTKVLILGSMPSQISIEKQQYYANPRNQFWNIIYSILSIPLPEAYEHRVKGILEHKIGLWDVLYTCQREGSSDSSINDEIPNNFSSLLDKCQGLKLIACNGVTARKMWQKHSIANLFSKMNVITLPSTSPALAKPLQYKLQNWNVLKQYLAD